MKLGSGWQAWRDMKFKESPETRALCRILERQGAMTYPLIASGWAPPGWPDRIIIHPSLHGTIYIEFKLHGEQPTPLQKRIHNDLRQHGAAVYVAYFYLENGDKFVGLPGDEYVPYSQFLRRLIAYHDSRTPSAV